MSDPVKMIDDATVWFAHANNPKIAGVTNHFLKFILTGSPFSN